jgi:hypothetical protein
MPARLREAKARRRQFSAEVLALFAKLEATPARQRRTQEFKDGAHQLARLLEQTDEYWTGNSVLDRGRPCHPTGYIATVHWARCRAMRKQLLGALELAHQIQPADEKAFPAP